QRGARDFDLRQQRRAHSRDEPRHVGLHLFSETDPRLYATPGTSDGRGQRTVGCGTYADGMETGPCRQSPGHVRDDLALEPDEPIGNQHALPLSVVSEWPQRLLDAVAHLGAALGRERL